MTSDVKEEIIQYYSKLLGFCIHLTGNVETGKDLCQTVYMKVLVAEIDNNTSLFGYLVRIARNEHINAFRRSKAVQFTHEFHDVNITDDFTPDFDLIIRSVGNLGGRKPDVMNMLMNGFKYREIAAKMGVDIGCIKATIFGARRDLRELGITNK